MNAQIKKSASAKMSQSSKVGADKLTGKTKKPPKTIWGKIWRTLLWLVLALLIILAIIISFHHFNHCWVPQFFDMLF